MPYRNAHRTRGCVLKSSVEHDVGPAEAGFAIFYSILLSPLPPEAATSEG